MRVVKRVVRFPTGFFSEAFSRGAERQRSGVVRASGGDSEGPVAVACNFENVGFHICDELWFNRRSERAYQERRVQPNMASNAGWRCQFRIRGQRHRSGVAILDLGGIKHYGQFNNHQSRSGMHLYSRYRSYIYWHSRSDK